MLKESSRRKLLSSIAIVSGVGLAGCTTISQQSTAASQEEEFETPYEPEDCPFVENGQLRIEQFIHCHDIVDLSEDTLSVEMSTMPNPVNDYEIEVYLTPMSEMVGYWSGSDAVHHEDDGSKRPWEPKKDSENVKSTTKFQDFRNHGEKVGSFIVPKETAGLYSGVVGTPDSYNSGSDAPKERPDVYANDGPDLGPKPISTMENIEGVDNAYIRDPIADSVAAQFKGRVDTTSPKPDDGSELTEIAKSDDYPAGATVKSPQYNIMSTPIQYTVDIDVESEIPKNVPYVLTFGIRDENSMANPDTVATSSPQFMRIDNDEFVYESRLGDYAPLDVRMGLYCNPIWLENRTYLESGESFAHFADSDKLYKNNMSENGDVRSWNITRVSNYGRFTPKGRDDNDFVFSKNGLLDPEDLFGEKAPHYLDCILNHLWSVDYEIDKLTVQKAKNLDNRTFDKKYYNYTRNPEVQDHPVVQDVAEQLRNICDRMEATTPTEELRVVSDFVQYFTHTWKGEEEEAFISGEYPEEWNMTSLHPVTTLYRGEGDCVSFTILANTILRTDYFGYDTDIGHISGENTFTGRLRNVGHVSTTVPFNELEVDSIDDAHVQPAEMDFEPQTAYQPKFNSNATYVGSNGEAMYIEMSGNYMLGMSQYNIATNVESY